MANYFLFGSMYLQRLHTIKKIVFTAKKAKRKHYLLFVFFKPLKKKHIILLCESINLKRVIMGGAS